MRERYRKFYDRIISIYQERSIQLLLTISFSVVTILGMALLGGSLYARFAANTRELATEDNKKLMDQVCLSAETYIRNMMRVSDTMYYAGIKKTDLKENTLDAQMSFLYEANKDSLISIACFTADGELISASPVSNLKRQVDVTSQDWFRRRMPRLRTCIFHSSCAESV